MADLTITNALVIPMTERRHALRGFVRVTGDTIVEVAAGSPGRARADEMVIDGAGCVLLPGLINAHTHLYQVLMRALWEDLPLVPWLKRIYGAARVLRPEHFYAGTLLGCVEAIRGGVTTVCEHNFLNPHPDCALETARAMEAAKLRAVLARTIMDTGEIVPECVREKPDEAFARIESLMARGPRSATFSWMTGPNTPPLNATAALLKEIRRFADEKGIGISAHVAEARAVVELARREHGKSGVVELLSEFGIPGRRSVFAHCVHLEAREIALLKESGTSVSHNPVSNMMLGDGVAPVVEMLQQGVNVALGTDGAASNHSQDLFETMKVASLLQKVHHRDAAIIDPYTVLEMATAGGAKALGLAGLCGTIETGKRADLILVRIDACHIEPVNDVFSQLVHCARSSDVVTTVVNGEILMRDRVLLGLDEERVLEEARRAHRDLRERLAGISF
ncbi:MAG TPA: amidohydrolase [candidate division Zixibacteria bacterium]|nr:amidohydrolase [candidate division Zixibacteria bacterium]